LQDSNLNVGQTNWFHICGRLRKIIYAWWTMLTQTNNYKLISIYLLSSVLDSRDYYKPNLEHGNCVINGYNGPSSTWATSRPGPVRKGKAMKFLYATLFLCFIHSEEKNIILLSCSALHQYFNSFLLLTVSRNWCERYRKSLIESFIDL
jgi:hypothetical protein